MKHSSFLSDNRILRRPVVILMDTSVPILIAEALKVQLWERNGGQLPWHSLTAPRPASQRALGVSDPAQSSQHMGSASPEELVMEALDRPLSSLHDPVQSTPTEMCGCLPTTRDTH